MSPSCLDSKFVKTFSIILLSVRVSTFILLGIVNVSDDQESKLNPTVFYSFNLVDLIVLWVIKFHSTIDFEPRTACCMAHARLPGRGRLVPQFLLVINELELNRDNQIQPSSA